jgi:hypothetical protein
MSLWARMESVRAGPVSPGGAGLLGDDVGELRTGLESMEGRMGAALVVVRQLAAGPTLVGRGDLARQVAVAAVDAGGQLVDAHHERDFWKAGTLALP